MAGTDSPELLISRAIAGDRLALQRLLLTFYDRLSARIARKLSAELRGAISEEDILQESLCEAFQRIRDFKYQGSDSFYHWLATIAEHRLLDAAKARRANKRGGAGRAAAGQPRHQHRPAQAVSGVERLIDQVWVDEHSPSGSAARHEAASAVRVALAGLDDDYRQAVWLRYFEGLPVAEVACRMNRTDRAVHNLCHRGLERLRLALGDSSQYFHSR